MGEDDVQVGRISRDADHLIGRLGRHLGHAPEIVWKMLTDAATLPQWLAPGTIEPRKGGRVHVDFGDSGVVIDSTVLEFDPPRLLSYSWSSSGQPERPLRWDLSPESGGTRLVLTVQLPTGEDIAKACAGYEAHLEMLGAALEGVPIRFPFQLYQAARKAYQQQLGAPG